MKPKPVLLSKDGRQKKVYSRTLFLMHKSPKTDERPIGMIRLVDQDDAPKSRYYKKERKNRNRRSRASRDEDPVTVEKVAAEEKMHLESLLNYVAFNGKDKRTFHNVESPPPPPAVGRNNNDSSGNISTSNEEAYAEKVFHYPKPQFLHGRAVLSPYAPFFYETSNVVPPEVAPKRTELQAETDEGNNNTQNLDVSSPPSPPSSTGDNKTVEESPKEKEEQMKEEKAEEQNEEEVTNDTNQQEGHNSAKEEDNTNNTATMTSPCTATTPTTTTTKTGEEENMEMPEPSATTTTAARTAGLNAKAVPFQPVDLPSITRNGVPPTPPALGGGQPQHGAMPWGGPPPSGLHNTSTGLPPTSNDMSSMMGIGCMGPGAAGMPYPPPFPQSSTMGMSMADLMWMMYPWGMMQPPPPPGPPPKKKDSGAKNQVYGPKDSEYNRRTKHEWKDNWQAMHNTNGGRPLGSGTSSIAQGYKKNGSVHNSASAVPEKKYNNNSWSLSKVIGGRAQGTGAVGIPLNNNNSSSNNNNINNTDNAAGAHNNGGGKAHHYGKNNHAAPYGQPQYGAKKMWHASNNVWSYHHSTNTPTQPRRMYGVKVA